MYEVLLWDDRDKESKEPASMLGDFDSLIIATRRLLLYLDGVHSAGNVGHIYKIQIKKKETKQSRSSP